MSLQMADRPFWTGDWNAHTINATYAPCNGFNCVGSLHWSSASVAGGAYMDITQTVRDMLSSNLDNGWFILWGEENSGTSYKEFEYSAFRIYATYDTPTQQASPSSKAPADHGTVVTTQPSLAINPVTPDPDTNQIYYYYQLATGTDAESGAVVNSGWTTATQFTIPDNVLQDGTTYYWHVHTADNNQGIYYNPATWTRSFKVDMRTGKDPTQAYDSVGPASIDLATGNLTTSNSSHSISALGGSIGVGLDYNSPQRSRPGLVGEYWNNATRSGNPTIKRVDTDVDFDWANGSPGSGVGADSFSARWTGYFTAPTTGTYYFGGQVDDDYTIYLNNQQYFSATGPSNTYGNAITLQAGQVVPIKVEYAEGSGSATMKLKVKGAVTETVIKTDWLQTGIRPVGAQHGLVGRYFNDSGSHTFPTNDSEAFMARTDPQLSFDWGTGTPITGGPVDNFMVRWTGYFIAPTAGTYEFGTQSDDGSRIIVNGNTTYTKWSDTTGVGYGSGVALTQGQIVPITIEYYEHTGSASVQLLVRNAVPEQTVPADWLAPQIPSLPAGWTLNADPDGNLSYDRLRATNSGVTLYDSAGTMHEYTWTGGGYKPPVNEGGTLVRNSDGTYNLQDVDGRTYVFNSDGTLKETVTPQDDRKPAALKYTYGGSPARLTQITDGVTNTRYANIFYSGDSGCGSAPTGFTGAPAGMVCAVKTSDNDVTNFWYKNNLLARIERPGGVINDYGYDTDGRIVSVRDGLAADAIAAAVRTDDANATTQITYDAVGRVASITAPAATAGATRAVHTYEYLVGSTQKHITNAPEPNGFSRRVEYDATYRTTKSTDVANLAVTTEWDAVKDLVLSTTDPTGLKSTTIYDDADRPTHTYGPAPSSWFATDRTPLTANASQVPHNETRYDESIKGLASAYYNYSSGAKSLINAPQIHATGIRSDNSGDLSNFFGTTSPIPNVTSNWGMRLTGKFRLPASGNYTFRLFSDNGVRMWIDDVLVIDDWNDGGQRSHPSYTFSNTANSLHRIQIDYYHTTGDSTITAHLTPPGGTETWNWGSYLTPAYNLATTQVTYDAALGNTTSTTNYGSNPEYGLVQSTTIDPTGLNYTNTASYESPGSGFLRQTSKTLPGGTTTNYAYYSATDTADNPCTTTVETIHQGGRIKSKTEADPDGAGTQTGRVTQTVYDAAGRVVANRYNTDAWTCTNYDARGRVTQVAIPAFNGEPARTIHNYYTVDSSPLKQATGDENGDTITEVDLLGRTVSYMDTIGDWTGYGYDDLGRLIRKYGDMGEQNFAYDNYDRLTEQKFENTVVATPHYDTYGRLTSVDYPAAGTQKLASITRDSLGRTIGKSWQLGSGATVSDSISLSQSGLTTGGTENGATKSYTYDKAGRLTNATIGSHQYTYSFGPQDTDCATNTNPNSGKNSNRTQLIKDGTYYEYCYDYADRLTSSSDPTATDVWYDDHGNMRSIGQDTATPLLLFYDSSDRNRALEQTNSSGTGVATYYARDVTGRIVYREQDTITNWNWVINKAHCYGYTGSGDSPALLRDDATWTIVEKYVPLPGGGLLTIRPTETQTNNKKLYSLTNLHGDVMTTTNAAGTKIADFTYDPFGNILGSTPTNSQAGVLGWAGEFQKNTETTFNIDPMQMGARVYFPTLGRFAQVDPVEGGTLNSYVYAGDPVNSQDYSGRCVGSFSMFMPLCAAVLTMVNSATGGISAIKQRWRSKTAATGQSTVQPRPQDPMERYYKQLMPNLPDHRHVIYGPAKPFRFDWVHAISSAQDYSNAGKIGGGALGCYGGAAATLPVGGAGCLIWGPLGAAFGGIGGAITGFFVGGFDSKGADVFEGAPDTVMPFEYNKR